MIELIRPYPGESEESFTKRKAYYYRVLMPYWNYSNSSYLAKTDNIKPISSADLDEINAFWDNVFSSRLPKEKREKLIDYRYYNVYNKILAEGEQLSQYIPDTFFYLFVDEYYTNPQHSNPCDDKNLYDLYFHDVNRPQTVFRKLNEIYLDENYNEITLDDAINRAKDCEEVILKIGKFSYGGKGVMFWKSDDSEVSKMTEFMKNCRDVVCQKVIKQHSDLSRLNPTSVNTVRIMTLMQGRHVHVLSGVLRMGINGSRTDNASSGGIVCGIKPTGQLKEVAYDTSANKYERHPQRTSFESVTVPNYSECVNLTLSLAKRLSSISRLISWDLAIDEKGHPLLLEANFSGGELDFHQLCNGPILGDVTQDVLRDVLNNSYTLNSIIKSL